jgi:hypothetical protein
MLQHVFDPPPTSLAVPWGYLLTLLAVIAGIGVVSAVCARRLVLRLPLSSVLRAER